MLYILASRIQTICFTVIIFIVGLGLCYLLFVKQYSAESSILIGQGSDIVAGNTSPTLVSPSYISTQVGVIESSLIALQVVKDISSRYDLKTDDELKNFILSGGASNQVSWLGKLYSVVDELTTFSDKANNKKITSIKMTEALQKKLKVKPGKESSIIYIKFKSNNPEYSEFVANAFAASYINTIRILTINNSHITPDMHELMTSLEQISKKTSGGYSSESPRILLSPVIQSLSESVALLKVKKGEIYSRVGNSHPDYKSIDDQILNLEAQLQSETLKLKDGISITSNMGIGILEYAYAPDEYDRPPFLLMLIATTFLSILIGTLIALLQEKFNPIVRSISDLKVFEGLEIIATIPPKNYSIYAVILGKLSGHHENTLH
ncbi:hypothetical protein G6653_08645 [Polynucleobacter paneuropaeus]|jgi:uncharacterized protein involved in exopolysaccharide biosynthesis|nr:hypothetical protein [Polynucleobacter paneuropaeus]MBT8612030.1 hypothetical protein [Polynucleobacter paneuropaeus]